MAHRSVVAAAFIACAIVATGIFVRWPHLDDRPLHVDEAVQAYQTWQLLRGEGYSYDPHDRHGPLLYYVAAAIERMRGGSAATMTDAGVRAVSLLAGAATLTVLLLARRRCGDWPLWIGCALVAFHPLVILHHTYFVQEAWLALFTWTLLFAFLHYREQPTAGLAVTIGLLAGFMQCTKESAPLHLALLALALGIARGPVTRTPHLPRHALLALLAAFAGYALFYSSLGKNPSGLIDGLRAYALQWHRIGDPAHSQPWYHYIALMLPHRSGGVWWGETSLLIAMLLGAIATFRRNPPPVWRAIAVFTLSLFMVQSLVPYKTPWLMLTPTIGFCLLAGFGIVELARLPGRWWRPAAIALASLTVMELSWRTQLALDRYPGDERNPYFYQQTPRTIARLLTRLDALRRAAADAPVQVAVVGPDHAWPLPWYLRDWPQVGYFESNAEVPARDWDVVIRDSRVDPPKNAAIPDGDIVEMHGLRPNVLLLVQIRGELWQKLPKP